MGSTNVSFGWKPPTSGDDGLLAHLVDRTEIIDVTHRYAWALDTRQWSDLDDVFCVDATAHLPTYMDSLDAIKRRVRRVLEPLDVSQHIVTNHQILVEGAEASCRCQLQAQHVRTRSGQADQYLVGGHYVDRLVRTQSGWRIAHRELTITWTHGDSTVVRPDPTS